MSYITLDEIEKAIKPFLGKLELKRRDDLFLIEVKDSLYHHPDSITFFENGNIHCSRSGYLVQNCQKFIDKLFQEELIVNWNDEVNEGYFVNKNAKVESIPTIMAKLNALYQENLKLRKELEEKIDCVRSDLADHERDYNHERTNNYY